LASAGIIASAHDLSDGGLAVALAESCLACSSVAGAGHAAPRLGANVSVDDPAPAQYVLFGERGARAVVSVSPENLAAVLAVARQYGLAPSEIGQVTHNGVFRIEHKGHGVIESPVALLFDAWGNALERGIRQ
ncbi:MAG TPA: AIR synthase-related protein, partial [Candidatus Acidoferrum sp.]